MSKAIDLRIRLSGPAIFSERAVTTGGHRSLHYVPGSALLGLAAGRFYRDSGVAIDGVDTWTAFHSGRIRFGSGYPVATPGRVAYPLPRAFHRPKSGGPYHNFSLVDVPEGSQFKQVRSGFVTSGGQKAAVRLTTGLKTAVQPETGAASSGQLFGNEYLEAGQDFVARLTAEDGAERMLDVIVAFLATGGKGRHRIGRSRSAEFGEVEVEALAAQGIEEDLGPPKDTVRVWCLSDAWLPSVQRGELPTAEELGLPGGSLNLSRTFLHTRRYSPFNGRWQVPAPERIVLGAGSVMTFEKVGTPRATGLGHCGLGQESGLGAILMDARILSQDVVEFQEAAGEPAVPLPEPAGSPLWKFMVGRVAQSSAREQSLILVDTYVAAMLANYRTAAQLSGTKVGTISGPGKTQWNAVAEAARSATSVAKLKTLLFDDASPIIPVDDALWSIDVDPQRTHRSALVAVIAELEGRDAQDQVLALQQIARKMVDLVEQTRVVAE